MGLAETEEQRLMIQTKPAKTESTTFHFSSLYCRLGSICPFPGPPSEAFEIFSAIPSSLPQAQGIIGSRVEGVQGVNSGLTH